MRLVADIVIRLGTRLIPGTGGSRVQGRIVNGFVAMNASLAFKGLVKKSLGQDNRSQYREAESTL